MGNLNKKTLIKDVNKSLYSDGVRINISHQHIFNSPKSINYTKRGSSREITVSFNNKKFMASYRYEGQKNKNVHLESIRFRKDLKEEFKKVYPEPIGRFTIELGKDENEFIFKKHELIDKPSEEIYYEGKQLYKKHKMIERNSKVIKQAKDFFKIRHGKIFCQICGFNFEDVYGKRGSDFIEGHHKKFVSKMKEGEGTKIEDIVLVCSNCHRMLHKSPYISVEELREYLKINNSTL